MITFITLFFITRKIYMSVATKSDPKLWQQVVSEVRAGTVAGPADTWNARKAQLAVKIYKKRGGEYIGRRNTKNSLRKWTDEDWGYIDDKPGNRYLPRKVRDSLTSAEKRDENRRKRSATRRHSMRARYSNRVKEKLRRSRRQ
jgi:hypothetical protein